MVTTTTFGPSSRAGALPGYVGTPRIARAGGCNRNENEDNSIVIYSNETTPDPWYSGSPGVGAVGAAFKIVPFVSKQWRQMFRFVLRDVTQDRSAIVSGLVPQLAWWPLVTAATLNWFNGNLGGEEAQPQPPTFRDSDLDVYAGRTLYVPAGSTPSEAPFGRTTSEAATTYGRVGSHLTKYDTLPYATWAGGAGQVHTWKQWALPPAAIDALLKTISGDVDAFIDFAFVSTRETVDGTNFKQEIGCWDPFPPFLSVEFTIPDLVLSTKKVVAFVGDGRAEAMLSDGRGTAWLGDGRADALTGTGRVGGFVGDGRVETVGETE